MNKKLIIVALSGLIVGLCIGIMLTIIFYPFIFPPPEVNEQVTELETKEVVETGKFIHPDPSDPIHWGKGDVIVYQHDNTYEVFLDKNFEVGPGPAYHVYLSTGNEITNNSQFKEAINFDLGKLKSFKSSQVYQVPADIEFSQVNSIIIWCEAFGQLISSATFKN